jgi:arsenate reductase
MTGSKRGEKGFVEKILVLCTGNSARSQMGEGLFRHEGGGQYEIHSAGTKPSRIRPEAVAVMKEIGIDISGHRSKSVDEFSGQSFDYVVTVCDSARDNCPLFPADIERIHWSFEDPAAVEGNDEVRLAAFRRIRDQIQEYVRNFVRDRARKDRYSPPPGRAEVRPVV